MSNDDLERRLRTESGPREQGYAPTPLPDAPGALPPARRPRRAMQGALVLATVGAGVLAVAAVSALMSPGAPGGGVGEGGDPTVTPVATTSPRLPTDCQPADLELTAEPWGGAAGSRGTVVTIGLADGRYPCIVQRHIGGAIADANGETLVAAVVPLIYDPVLIEPDSAFTVGVSWTNWCGAEVARPVSLTLGFSPPLPVEVPAGTDPVPPCMGENAESALNVTQVQPAD